MKLPGRWHSLRYDAKYSKQENILQQERRERSIEDDPGFLCKSRNTPFTAVHLSALGGGAAGAVPLAGVRSVPSVVRTGAVGKRGKSPQPGANEVILPFPKSKRDQLTPLTQRDRELGCFCSACLTLPQSQEVWGVGEDKTQVYENVKPLLCYSHKATVSSMARSDYLVSKIGSLNYTQISDYLLWAGS